jgi:Methyltransferase domain
VIDTVLKMSRTGRRLRSRALWWLARRAADRTGHELVGRDDFYSPLPDLEALPDSLWSVDRELFGVDLRLDAAVELLAELRPYLAEFPSAGVELRNGTYEAVDAELLYAMLRHHRPARVVELGSGSSSHVIWAAQLANRRDGHGFEHRIFDPNPFEASALGPVQGPSVASVRAELIDAREVTALRERDVLFVDTTHTVKTGGDVNRIVLELLPQVAPGVLIHFHDIFLPFEYPRAWVVEHRMAWAEQYLLQAFLAFNQSFEVVFPACAMASERRELLERAIPSLGPAVAPGAFWIRRLS